MITVRAQSLMETGDDSLVLTVEDMHALARQKLPADVYADWVSGAEEELTLTANETAWRALFLRPRVLVDVDEVDTSIELLGLHLPSPVVVSAGGNHRLVLADGEAATARGAAASGCLMLLSTFATTSIEDVAAAAPEAPRWFQLYVTRDRGLSAELIARAEAADYCGIVVTVDAPVGGRRLTSMRAPMQMREGIASVNLPATEVVPSYAPTQTAGGIDPALNFADLESLVGQTRLPIIVKGVLRGDDARRIVDCGAASVVASNHGGRQLDSAVPTAWALREVVDAVGDQVPVLVDGGVRSGIDVFKALSLGARAVLVARPVLWALAVDSSQGVTTVLNHLRDELARSMRLSGMKTVGELSRDLLVAGPGFDLKPV